MNNVVYDEPPTNQIKPGLFHPLCCYVRALYFQNALKFVNYLPNLFLFFLSKAEIFDELRTEIGLQRPMRSCLRRLCFLLSNVSHPTPGQMDLGTGFLD